MDLSSSRDAQGRPPVRKTDTDGQSKPVKPAGTPLSAESSPARNETPSSAEAGSVWERVFARSNLFAALDRVEKNAGAPGSDGLRVDALRSYLPLGAGGYGKDHWLETRSSLDAETYRPTPVRRVEIPKPDGGVRLLGIPTVLDRLTAQRTSTGPSP
jgi:RNA-directed DNA polymerase